MTEQSVNHQITERLQRMDADAAVVANLAAHLSDEALYGLWRTMTAKGRMVEIIASTMGDLVEARQIQKCSYCGRPATDTYCDDACAAQAEGEGR